MWRIVKATGITVFLLACSAQDIKEKKISVKILILAGVLLPAMSLLFDEMPGTERLYGMLPGMTAFLLALLTKEGIGYGDAAVLAILGTAVSGRSLFGALVRGLILLSICSMILLAGKRVNRKTTLPFLPFLSAGMLWQVLSDSV